MLGSVMYVSTYVLHVETRTPPKITERHLKREHFKRKFHLPAIKFSGDMLVFGGVNMTLDPQQLSRFLIRLKSFCCFLGVFFPPISPNSLVELKKCLALKSF